MSGFGRDVYDGYLRGSGSVDDLELHSYSRAPEQDALLAECLRQLRAAGYRDAQISVLSFCQPESSSAARLAAAGHRLAPAEPAIKKTGYASVHAFKGLDNAAVVLTDVVVGSQEFHRHLFYTAMTRSTGPLRMLCHVDSLATIQDWIQKGCDV